MSCDHQALADHVCDYIDGKLTPALRARCDEAVQHCVQCREVHAHALEFYRLAGEWQDQAVPDWNRARFAVAPPRQPHGSWPSWLALAASVTAIALVLLQMEISTTNGLLISFGGTQTDARVRALVAAELERHTAAQDLLLEARLVEFMSDHLNANQLLLARWQDATRAERHQELALLLSNWQSQRFEDQQEVNNQLTSLANYQIENYQYVNALLQNAALPRRN